MDLSIYVNDKNFEKSDFDNEESLENAVIEKHKILFGDQTILLNIKKKVESKTFGGAIPDGILFDFTNKENPQFYLVEIELSTHDFYGHIFPQITKFMAFFKNSLSREKMIEGLFAIIKSDSQLEEDFKKKLGNKEIYKTLKDVIENSYNILLVIDSEKPEFEEMCNVYDEWDKKVTIEVLTRFTRGDSSVFVLSPPFEKISFGVVDERAGENYRENDHLDGKGELITSIFKDIKNCVQEINPNIQLNPRKYYIAVKGKRNFALIYLYKKWVDIVVMLPYESGRELIKNYKIDEPPQRVQKYYGGECFNLRITDNKHLDEIRSTLKKAYDLRGANQ